VVEGIAFVPADAQGNRRDPEAAQRNGRAGRAGELIAKPWITAPIVSATSLKQLDEMVAKTRLKLSMDEVTALDATRA